MPGIGLATAQALPVWVPPCTQRLNWGGAAGGATDTCGCHFTMYKERPAGSRSQLHTQEAGGMFSGGRGRDETVERC